VKVVPEIGSRIHQWVIAGDRLAVSSIQGTATHVSLFDFSGRRCGELPVQEGETVRLIWGSPEDEELLYETESFLEPVRVWRYSTTTGERRLWSRREIPFDPAPFSHEQHWYQAKDGTRIPISLLGRKEVLASGCHPAILTAYGGYGVSMTPQFSVLVAYLVEHGCLFALPNIRGGSEFGAAWHQAGKRQNRQTAYDDFLSAAEWLMATGRTRPDKLAIFGGSNSGLLVGAALTQRPELFRAAVCLAPMLDMLRYHLFDGAHVWREEFGTAEDADDFRALFAYSPYHRVRDGTAYPATLIVSGDADQNCNPLHARKMAARLQAASSSGHPVLLDYSAFRGHSPVLPLSERVGALTDRVSFICEQLQIEV
jgi:prolyl oligopeptidase